MLFLILLFDKTKKMKRFLFLFTCVFLFTSIHSFAQKKKHKKDGDYKMPTEAQLIQYKEYLKKILKDSINIPLEKRDTAASIEMKTILKKIKINSDKMLSKEDKDVQYGMLDDDMYMHLGTILTIDELQRVKDFDQRQKIAAEAAEKERKDAENKRNTQSGMGGYGRYNRGYGGYGGY